MNNLRGSGALSNSVLAVPLLLGSSFLILTQLIRHKRNLSPLNFINPDSIDSPVNLNMHEDDFIVASWQWVAENISYKGFGSAMEFVSESIRCERCQIPFEVMRDGMGNCVGKSALLASILRKKLDSSRVYMALGYLNKDQGGVLNSGGHAWVVVRRIDGNWYLVESTLPPSYPNPWKLMEENLSMYLPTVTFSDRELNCADERICKNIS